MNFFLVISSVMALISNAFALDAPLSISQAQKELGPVEIRKYGSDSRLLKDQISIPGMRTHTQSSLVIDRGNGLSVKIFEIEQTWDKYGSMAWHNRMCKIVDAKMLGDDGACCVYFLQKELRFALLKKKGDVWGCYVNLVLNIPLTPIEKAEIIEANKDKVRIKVGGGAFGSRLPDGTSGGYKDLEIKTIEVDLVGS